MQTVILIFSIFCALLAAALFFTRRSGRSDAEAKQEKANAKAMERDAEIDGAPNINDPLGRM